MPMTVTLKKMAGISLLVCVYLFLSVYPAPAQETNPLFSEKKIKNYLPHMTWKEVEEALTHTDMIIIPVGSMEQHGPHLPLGTDFYGAIEPCKMIAQEADVLVAPVVMVGLSKYHMGFPGTITLSPETFEAVLFESSKSLIKYGFKRIMFYNGHGGNITSVNNVIRKINQETDAAAILLNDLKVEEEGETVKYPEYDWHAGEEETSLMLYLTPGLPDMEKAEKPRLTLPDRIKQLAVKGEIQPKFFDVMMAGMFCPQETGKNSSTREMTDNGVFSTGDPKNANVEKGKKLVQPLIKAAIKFINDWKSVKE